jgi:hypothetical protein
MADVGEMYLVHTMLRRRFSLLPALIRGAGRNDAKRRALTRPPWVNNIRPSRLRKAKRSIGSATGANSAATQKHSQRCSMRPVRVLTQLAAPDELRE